MSERERFLAALEISDLRARQGYLDRACLGDAALRARVESLLRSHREAGSFLERPAAFEGGETTRPRSTEMPGEAAGVGQAWIRR